VEADDDRVVASHRDHERLLRLLAVLPLRERLIAVAGPDVADREPPPERPFERVASTPALRTAPAVVAVGIVDPLREATAYCPLPGSA
jgi:hypothetical protein